MGELSTSIIGNVRTTATIVDTKINDNPSFLQSIGNNQGIVEDLQAIPESLNDSTESLKSNTALFKEFGNMMPEMIKNFRAMNDAVVRTNQNLPSIRKNVTSEETKKKRNEELARQGLLGFFNNGNNILASYANGNVGGVTQGVIGGSVNTVNNLSKMAENADNADLAKLLTKIGIAGAITGAVVKGADVLANKYIDEMPTIFDSGRAFGDMSNAGAMSIYNKINEYNRGTNLTIDEFHGLAQSLRKQGLGNGLDEASQLDLVGSVSKRVGQLAYMTGGDANQFTQLAGMMARYGGSKNVAGDMDYLVAAGRASGLNDSQIPEFLSGIQKVMEDGISKGFTRSATEVADTLLMFSKMSGNNAYWQSEQGARTINQANAGLASATSLSKTSDILAFRAFSRAYNGKEKDALGKDLYMADGDYVNTMMLMEKGLNAQNFGSIMSTIGETTDSKVGQIERLRQMFGLNYTGAVRMFNLNRDDFKSEADFEAELKKIQNDPEMQNNETRNQKALNDIKVAVVNVGEGLANMKIAGMDGISTAVTHIEKWLGMDYANREKEMEAEKILNSLSPEKKSIAMSNMKYYGDKDLGLERLRELRDYNGLGTFPGPGNKYSVFDSPDKLTPNIRLGEKDEDLIGAWRLKTTATPEEFIKEAWGEEILNQKGSLDETNAFIDAITNPDNRRNKDIREFQDMLYKYSDGLNYTVPEQNETLNKILELLKSGIEITYNK